jgi:hypothetical protein
MIGASIPKKPHDASPEVPEVPHIQPRTGAGADTALEALIRKRQQQTGGDTTPPSDSADKSADK